MHAECLVAVSAGAIALDGLRGQPRGTVVGKFAHSLYVRFEAGTFVCIGDEAIGAGPLNILLPHGDWMRLRAFPLAATVEASAGALSFGDAFRITQPEAASWRPRHAAIGRDAIPARLGALLPAARTLMPQMGLARLAFCSASEDDADPLLRIARPAWNALEGWLADRIASPMTANVPDPMTRGLIGLGPGLTPSGDDVLCGVLIALNALGLEHPAAALWFWVQPQLAHCTSELSAAHVHAAALGEGHETLHAVLEWMADGGSAPGDALLRLGQSGHCSGWDALAGVVLVLRVYAGRDSISRVASSAACAFDGATITPARSNVRHCAE